MLKGWTQNTKITRAVFITMIVVRPMFIPHDAANLSSAFSPPQDRRNPEREPSDPFLRFITKANRLSPF